MRFWQDSAKFGAVRRFSGAKTPKKPRILIFGEGLTCLDGSVWVYGRAETGQGPRWHAQLRQPAAAISFRAGGLEVQILKRHLEWKLLCGAGLGCRAGCRVEVWSEGERAAVKQVDSLSPVLDRFAGPFLLHRRWKVLEVRAPEEEP